MSVGDRKAKIENVTCVWALNAEQQAIILWYTCVKNMHMLTNCLKKCEITLTSTLLVIFKNV